MVYFRSVFFSNLQMHEWSACNKRSCDPEAVTPEQWRYILSLSSRRALKKEYLKPQTEVGATLGHWSSNGILK